MRQKAKFGINVLLRISLAEASSLTSRRVYEDYVFPFTLLRLITVSLWPFRFMKVPLIKSNYCHRKDVLRALYVIEGTYKDGQDSTISICA